MLTAPELGAFMVSACVVTAAIWHPAWPVRQSIQDPLVRRVLTGIAMACTAVCIIYSAWGKRSGAHFNPSVTLTFFRPGRVKPWDALFYVRAQFTGGVLGVRVAAQLLGATIKHSAVQAGDWRLSDVLKGIPSEKQSWFRIMPPCPEFQQRSWTANPERST